MHVGKTAAAALLGGLILATAPGALQACDAPVHVFYNQPVVLEGVLRTGTAHHDVQGDYTFTYLALDQGICVDGGDDDLGGPTPAPVDRIQLAGEAVTSELPIGTRVKAQGTLFPGHTMWHAEAVLMEASRIELK